MNAIVNFKPNNEVGHFDESKVELIKRTICRGASDDELELFVHTCKKTGLDPFSRQIFAVKRWDSTLKREVMSIQTGIDGYRLIADRTGNYSPGRESTFEYKEDGTLKSATSYVKKRTADGTWHEISATAHFDEYAQKTKTGNLTIFWATKPHIMLAKVAESAALRRAFPAELSGLYTQEEMPQQTAEVEQIQEMNITDEQVQRIENLIYDDEEFRVSLLSRLSNAFGCKTFKDLPANQYERVLKVIEDHNKKRLEDEMSNGGTLEEV